MEKEDDGTSLCKDLSRFYELAFGIFSDTKRKRQRLHSQVEITTLLLYLDSAAFYASS